MIRELSIQKWFSTKKLTNSKLVTNSFMIHLILRCWGVIRTFLGWVVNLFWLISAFPAGLNFKSCPFKHYSHCCITKTRSSNIIVSTVEWNDLIFMLVKEVEVPYTLEHVLCKLHYSFFLNASWHGKMSIMYNLMKSHIQSNLITVENIKCSAMQLFLS